VLSMVGIYMAVGQTASLGISPTGGTAGTQWTGEWNPATNYVAGDSITYLNYSYIAAAPNLNNPPPSGDWNPNNSSGAIITGVPTWSTTDAGIVTVTAAVDGLTCVLTAVGAGTATVTVTAQGIVSIDADSIVTVGNANLASMLSTIIDAAPF
jgi:hypothetical protein